MCSVPFVKGLERNSKPIFGDMNANVPHMDCEHFLQIHALLTHA